MKNTQSLFKNSTQTLVYLAEIVLFEVFILSLFACLEHGDALHWLNLINKFEIVSRITIILALHQLLIFSLVRLKFSAREDAIQSKIYCINLTLHLDKYDMDFSKLQSKVYELAYQRNDVMFNQEDIEWLKNLYKGIEMRTNTNDEEFKNNFKRYLESDKINFEHDKETQKYDWTNSFLLNLFK